MLKKLEFRLLFVILILLPIVRGSLRNILFGILIMLGTVFIMIDIKNKEYKLSLKKKDIEARIIIAFTLLIAYSCFSVILNGFSYSVLERIMQLYACLILLLATSIWEFDEKDYNFFINVIRIVILLCFIMWPISGFKTSSFKGIYTSSNTLGGVLFCYMGIYLAINRKYSWIDKIMIALSLVLMYFSNSRASLIAFAIFVIFRYLFTRNIIKNRNIILYILIFAFTIFPIIYVGLYQSEFRKILNEFSRKYFRKNFFSGRQVLWAPIIDAIKEKLLLGYGLDMAPEKILGIGRSSHNWYIQTLLQVGIIGYLLTINIIRIVWNALQKFKDNFTSLSVAGFIIGMLLWQCFEVVLTQNNIQVGLLVWFVMGIGVNNSLAKLNNNN